MLHNVYIDEKEEQFNIIIKMFVELLSNRFNRVTLQDKANFNVSIKLIDAYQNFTSVTTVIRPEKFYLEHIPKKNYTLEEIENIKKMIISNDEGSYILGADLLFEMDILQNKKVFLNISDAYWKPSCPEPRFWSNKYRFLTYVADYISNTNTYSNL